LIGAGVAGVRPAVAAPAKDAGNLLALSAFDVSAYPTNTRGDAASISLTTDMVQPGSIARDPGGRLYVTNAATGTVTI
jgi:hypothetical protein